VVGIYPVSKTVYVIMDVLIVTGWRYIAL